MLSWLTTRVRFCGAITLVALYAVCVVMPSVALAFPRGGTSSHCQFGDRHGVADIRLQDRIHIHTFGDGAIAKHAGNSMKDGGSKPKCHAGACCGLFCCAAVTVDSGAAVHASLLFGALDERLDGADPKRIGRPPKSILSL